MTSEEIILQLRSMADAKNVEGMARFGINSVGTLGVSMPKIRTIAKSLKKELPDDIRHIMSVELWDSGIHEARILSSLIDVPALLDKSEAERRINEIDSWDVCDQFCSALLEKTEYAYQYAFELTEREEEFPKRVGFVLIAIISVHDKKADDSVFEALFPIILRELDDDRNFVRKAVNWSLRQIGKRNAALNKKALALAEEILETESSKTAKWIARDAIRDMTSNITIEKFARAERKKFK